VFPLRFVLALALDIFLLSAPARELETTSDVRVAQIAGASPSLSSLHRRAVGVLVVVASRATVRSGHPTRRKKTNPARSDHDRAEQHKTMILPPLRHRENSLRVHRDGGRRFDRLSRRNDVRLRSGTTSSSRKRRRRARTDIPGRYAVLYDVVSSGSSQHDRGEPPRCDVDGRISL